MRRAIRIALGAVVAVFALLAIAWALEPAVASRLLDAQAESLGRSGFVLQHGAVRHARVLGVAVEDVSVMSSGDELAWADRLAVIPAWNWPPIAIEGSEIDVSNAARDRFVAAWDAAGGDAWEIARTFTRRQYGNVAGATIAFDVTGARIPSADRLTPELDLDRIAGTISFSDPRHASLDGGKDLGLSLEATQDAATLVWRTPGTVMYEAPARLELRRAAPGW